MSKPSKPHIDKLFKAVQEFGHRNLKAGINARKFADSRKLFYKDLEELGIAHLFDWSKE